MMTLPVAAQALSLFLPHPTFAGQLHLRHFAGKADRPVVFMLHGSISNSRVFWSDSGKGLAPYLARQGYPVYCADLGGRGQSTPLITRNSPYSQSDSICAEIPTLLEAIRERHPQQPLIWVAHSWGGVLLLAALARNPQYLSQLKALVLFGSKRCVRAFNWERLLKIDLFWKGLGPWLDRSWGYLPTKNLGVGSDNESRLSHLQSLPWIAAYDWLDPVDGFDYGANLRKLVLPPLLYLAAPNDNCLGHPSDVQALMREVGAKNSSFWLLSRARGFAHDYDHTDMLTHPGAVDDHFPRVLHWLQQTAG